MFYVYRFLDEVDNIIYVGKSKQTLQQRFAGHQHLPDECYGMVKRIEYIECATEADMSIKEIFYINKYQHNSTFFNVQDITQLPTSVVFDDEWEMYQGPLQSNFANSINYIQGFTAEKKIIYTKSGEVWKTSSNKQAGVSSTVSALTSTEVDLITKYLVEEIGKATNNNQEQIRYRNLLMFILGMNLPIKLNDFLKLKYKDLFDENDRPKAYALNLGRVYKDETIFVPLRNVVKIVLELYRHKYNLTYANNANDYFFESRKHQVLSVPSCWRILSEASRAVGIERSIGGESMRKTYGLNIYQLAENKLEALVFLEKLWGQVQYSNIIGYLGLYEGEVDCNFYLSETFSLCNVDLSEMNL